MMTFRVGQKEDSNLIRRKAYCLKRPYLAKLILGLAALQYDLSRDLSRSPCQVAMVIIFSICPVALGNPMSAMDV